ncbi:MAG: carboxypeptidase regulatory-like domain-containing protein [Candidatus Riflebacteria bacterium]|nr:carboxypeptidase regulatory-like domain-containing protein [Candidatus Riflebacteria bacterium]
MKLGRVFLLFFLAIILFVCPGCRVGDGQFTPDITGYKDPEPEPTVPNGKRIDGLISPNLLEVVDAENLIDRTDADFLIPGENFSEDVPIAQILKASSKRKLLILNLNYYAVLRDIKGKIIQKCEIDPNDGTFFFKDFPTDSTDLKVEIMVKKEYTILVALSDQERDSYQKVSLITFVEKTSIIDETGSSTSAISQMSQKRVIIDAETIAIAKIFEAGKIEAAKTGQTFTVEDAKKSPEKIQTVMESLNEVLKSSTENVSDSLEKVLEFRGEKLSDLVSIIMQLPKISNIIVSSITENSATITWTTDQPTTSQLEYGLSANYSNTTPIDNTLKTSHSVTLSNLVASATIHFRIRGKFNIDSQDTSSEITSENRVFKTLPSLDKKAPEISNFKIELVGLNTLEITWDTNEPAIGAVQYGESAKYGLFTSPKEQITQKHEYEISGFVPGKTYHFRAIAVDAAGNEAFTSNNPYKIPEVSIPEIYDLKVIPSTSTANISWVTENKCKRKIEYGLTKNYGEIINYTDKGNIYHTVTLSNLISGSEYFFKITVKDDKNKEGVFEGSFITLLPGAPVISDLVYSKPENGKLLFYWKTDQDTKSYVEYGLTFDYGTKSSITNTYSNTHSITIAELEEGNTYNFRAVSANSSGKIGYSKNLIINIPDITKPIISDITLGRTGTSSVSIAWKTNEPTMGRVKYGQSSNMELFSTYSDNYSSNAQASLSGLESGKNYFYKIVAKDSSGNEAESAIGTFSTQIAVVNLPPEIQIVASSTDNQNFWFQSVYEGSQLFLKAVATDPNPGDKLTYSWTSNNGTFTSTTAAETVWTAPFGVENAECFCTVTDSTGLTASTSVKIRIIPILKTGIGKIFGKLVDEITLQPIAGAVVGLADTSYKTVSAEDGTFEITNIDPGTYIVVIMRDDYLYKSIPNVIVTND